MIRRSVSAALLLRDGFTGAPLPQGAISCWMDGRRILAEGKKGGWMVLCDLAPGEHNLVLSGAQYQEEQIVFFVRRNSCFERVIDMKPGNNYPFGAKTAFLTIRGVPKDEALVWLGRIDERSTWKVMQNGVKPGDRTLRIFSVKIPAAGDYLLADQSGAEICRIQEADTTSVWLSSGIERTHRRGTAAYPVQCYQRKADGILRCAFLESSQVMLYLPNCGKLKKTVLNSGENTLELSC